VSATDELLRPAVELSWAVAREGARLRPPLPVPSALRPLLKFQKLSTAALATVRRVVEEDDEFRSRLEVVATDELVGHAGVLWLTRPEGWEAELEKLAVDAAAEKEAVQGARAEKDARKKLDAAEQAARTAQAAAATATAALELERRRREDAEQALAKLRRRADQLDIELAGARRRLEEHRDAADAADRTLAEVRAELAGARRDLELARAAGLEVEAELATARGDKPVARPSAEQLQLADALRAAAEANAAAGAALAAAASALMPAERSRPAAGRRTAVKPRRSPVPLPGGVGESSPEAAEHLLRIGGLLLVVDGYNVAKLAWPERSLADQRELLLVALDGVAARFPADVLVVFDGADVPAPPPTRRDVRVTFSPAGVTADDVIVQLVRELPPDRAVAVATNDGVVRRGARSAGANLLTSDQLVALARRA
jgi:hypothetical protein